jgi:hypothetical protein
MKALAVTFIVCLAMTVISNLPVMALQGALPADLIFTAVSHDDNTKINRTELVRVDAKLDFTHRNGKR